MCLPFGALFRKIWYSHGGGFIRDEGVQLHKLGVFWANYIVKSTQFGQNWVFFKNGILMGGKLGKKLIYRKSDFRGPAGTSTYDLGESNPTPPTPGVQK